MGRLALCNPPGQDSAARKTSRVWPGKRPLSGGAGSYSERFAVAAVAAAVANPMAEAGRDGSALEIVVVAAAAAGGGVGDSCDCCCCCCCCSCRRE